MIWLLSRLWAFGLVAFVAGFMLTWFTVVQKRTVRARVMVDRVHHAHARSGSTTTVGSSLEELHEEDVISGRLRTTSAPRSVGTEIGARRAERVAPSEQEERVVGRAMESRSVEPRDR